MRGPVNQRTSSNPGYEHSQRLSIACARAAMDVLGMTGSDHAADYRADYFRQRTQIQADSMGLEQWARRDAHRQGLLLEIRSSLAALMIALDQTSGTGTASASPVPVPLLPALDRVQYALSNYSASLTEPRNISTKSSLLSGPVLLRELLVLLLVELAVLAVLFFSITRIKRPLPSRADSLLDR